MKKKQSDIMNNLEKNQTKFISDKCRIHTYYHTFASRSCE